jgi:RNA polymerase sigma-70 factor (sigma-E family)
MLSETPADWAGLDADGAVTVLYSQHYRSLVRLAAFLVPDTHSAEEVVQDAFVAVHAAWPRLRDTGRALSYLRQSVVNRSRALRGRSPGPAATAPELRPGAPTAGPVSGIETEQSALLSALAGLPPRQPEVLVLRYYAGLTEAETAAVAGISRATVRRHLARGLGSLRAQLAPGGD